MKIVLVLLAILRLTIASAHAGEIPKKPRVFGDWWQVAGDPDLGELSDPKQQPVDFAVWQATDGTWQLWSCIRHTKERGTTRLFYRWEGARLTEPNWKPMGIALGPIQRQGSKQGACKRRLSSAPAQTT